LIQNNPSRAMNWVEFQRLINEIFKNQFNILRSTWNLFHRLNTIQLIQIKKKTYERQNEDGIIK